MDGTIVRCGPGSGKSAHGVLHLRAYKMGCITIPMYPCSRDWCEGVLPNLLIKSSSRAFIVAPVGLGANDGSVPINAVAVSNVIVGTHMFVML